MKQNFGRPVARRQSVLSTGSAHGKRHKYDVTAVESWNDLRQIGSEAKRPHHLANVLRASDEDLMLQEVQDWDYYIAKFNEQYRLQLQQPVAERDKESISTIADTKSQLMRGRHRRVIIFRKCFIFSCLLLWLICFFGAHEWYLTYLIYPIGFLQEMDTSVFSRYFTPAAVWYAFLINAHSWFVGSYGLLCACCFRENPRVLKQFILRVPYILLVPSILIFIAVRFVGTFSSHQLKKAMDKKIPEYHNFDNSTILVANQKQFNLSGKRLWDQLQKILKCCGVKGSSDWDSIDDDLSDDNTYWPSTCCPKRFVRRVWTKERPARDDCFHKVNKMENTDEYEWAYPQGCLNVAYEFFVKMGAYVVRLMVANFCGLVLCLIFGFKYYTLERKCENFKYKYSWKQWIADILFLNYFKCVPVFFKKCCKKCEKTQGADQKNKNKSFASGHQSQVSGDSTVTINLGGRVTRLPSVVITAPNEGSGLEGEEEEEEMPMDMGDEEEEEEEEEGAEVDPDPDHDHELMEQMRQLFSEHDEHV